MMATPKSTGKTLIDPDLLSAPSSQTLTVDLPGLPFADFTRRAETDPR